MTMNRVQFQPGLSLPEFLRQFGPQAACNLSPLIGISLFLVSRMLTDLVW